MFLNFCRLSVGDNSWRIRNTTYWFCWGYSRGGLWPWVLWWWVEGHSVTRVYHSGWEVQREASLSGGWTLQDIEVVCNRCLPKQWLFTPWLNDKLLIILMTCFFKWPKRKLVTLQWLLSKGYMVFSNEIWFLSNGILITHCK